MPRRADSNEATDGDPDGSDGEAGDDHPEAGDDHPEAGDEEPDDGHDEESRVSCTRRGLQFDVACEVPVAPDDAAMVLRDTHQWPVWSPTIDGVESDHRYVREGTRGRVRVAGTWLPFRVTGFNGRRWTWRVAGLPATGHRVEGYADDRERCQVVIEVPLPAAGYVPTCRRALRSFARLAVGGERGEKDGESDRPT